MINDAPSLREVSRQFWALLKPLIAESKIASTFANVDRHNGLEACRQLAEPINEDKELVHKDMLPLVTNPTAAANMEGVEEAVRNWDTNIRLFKKAGGVEPQDNQKRITLIRMLPVYVAAYISMHWELPEYCTSKKLRDFAFKCIKVLRKQVKKGHKTIGIFYGAAHNPDLETRLFKMGYTKGKQEWMTAWDVPKAGKQSAEKEKQEKAENPPKKKEASQP